MSKRTHKELVFEYAKAFNNLDSSFIKHLLVEDFHYASQWVFDEIQSREKYLNYFESKLESIKNSKTKVVARIGIYQTDYCILLFQIDLSKINKTKTASFIIKTDKGKILRADMCSVPTISEIQLLELLPS